MNQFNKKGMTLIEVILSITLLGIIAISILPMSMYSVKYAKWDSIKLNALNLANSQIEWLKSYDYEKLGLNKPGYDPKGEIEEDKYMNEHEIVEIEGVEYRLYTNIYWVGRKSTTGEPVPDALKGIDVIVEAKDLYSGKTKRYSVLETMVTREGEREPKEPGQLTVYTFFRDANTPVDGVKVQLDNGKIAYSNMEGEAFFANLSAKEYTVKPISWRGKGEDIIAKPKDVNNSKSQWIYEETVEVKDWGKSGEEIIYPEITFYIDFPGYIKFPENSNYPNFEISIVPKIDPPEGMSSDDYLKIATTIEELKNLKFWRLWEYEYEIWHDEGDNKDTYFLVDEYGTIWDGKFKLSDIYKPTYEKLELGFGLIEEGAFKWEEGKITEINIYFTSSIIDIESMEFSINDQEEIIIAEKGDDGNILTQEGKKVTITFTNPIEIESDELTFEIVKINENPNMRLVKNEEGKCTAILTLENNED